MRILTGLAVSLFLQAGSLALAQPVADGLTGPRERMRTAVDRNTSRTAPSGPYSGFQIDATPFLMDPPPPGPAEREPRPVQRPMFSDGWTRDGFGGRPSGWR